MSGQGPGGGGRPGALQKAIKRDLNSAWERFFTLLYFMLKWQWQFQRKSTGNVLQPLKPVRWVVIWIARILNGFLYYIFIKYLIFITFFKSLMMLLLPEVRA
jgi:hypothetical protein